jgi:hypothetical protein
LFGSTDMSTPIRRDDIIDLVTRNRHPSAVYLHLRLWVGLQSIRLQHEPPSFLLSVE